VDQVVTVKPAFELLPLAAYRVLRNLRRRVAPGGWHGGNAALRPPCGHCRAAACEEPAPHDGARAVHFVIDGRHSERLRADWPPDAHMPLELVDCPGRSLAGCAVDLIRDEAELPGAEVTVILPPKHRGADGPDRPRPAGWHGRPDHPGVGPGARRRGDDYRAAGAASWSPGRSEPS
jgi:hypothetical protein